MSALKAVMLRGWDLVFPPHCLHCERVGALWCDACTHALAAEALQLHRHHADGLYLLATAPHSGLMQDAVQALKYHGAVSLAQPLGHRLAQAARRSLKRPPDLIVPVPLSAERQAARGYNQAALIAQVLSSDLRVPIHLDALVRTRHTRPQVGLSRADRLTNMTGAFAVPPQHRPSVKGRTVMVIDDVHTTGATLRECLEALMQAGATRAYGVTLTHA